MLIDSTPQGLHCEAGAFHIDPWQPVERAVITHAHADHLRPGSRHYLCAAASIDIVRRRLPAGSSVTGIPYGQQIALDGVRLSFHPAGHVLGSAQIRVEHRGEVWIAAGDYNLAVDPTCAAFEPLRCHTFITEATFGLPHFRWPSGDRVIDDVMSWWDEMRQASRPAVLFAYALGTAQRILAELSLRTDRPVFVHGALSDLNEIYRTAGVRMVPTRLATDEPKGRSFAGELILAPVAARGSLWMRRFNEHSSAFASGWMRIRGARRRRGYDRGFALSDHADWPALLQAVAASGAEQIYVTHGYAEPLARYLASRGFAAHAWTTRFEGEPEGEDV